MFIRKRTINGRDYYQAIRCYRERVWDEEGRRVPGGKIRNKVVASLGHHPTIEAAWRGAAEEYLATSKRGGKGDRKKWERIKKLDRVLKAYRKKRGEPFEPDPRIEEHRGKWNWSESRAAAEAKRKKEREWDEAWRRFIGGSREQEANLDRETIRRLSEGLVLLGFEPLPTEGPVKAAFRRKARESHPDHGGSDEAMVRLKEAYDLVLKLVLGDFDGLSELGHMPRLAGPDS